MRGWRDAGRWARRSALRVAQHFHHLCWLEPGRAARGLALGGCVTESVFLRELRRRVGAGIAPGAARVSQGPVARQSARTASSGRRCKAGALGPEVAEGTWARNCVPARLWL